MALGYLLSPALQVENINGKPLVGGTITVYRHGTTNPYITYKDFTGDRNPADVVLNNKGMAVILADPNLVYDVYCRDADGVEQWSRLNVTVADPIGAGDGRIYNITSEDGSITSTSSVDVQTGVTTFDLSVTNPARDYTTRGSWDRSLQIDNNAHTISGDMQCVAIRQQINNSSSTYKYAKVCEADINTVTWINEWATTLQLSFQSSGAYYKGKSTGIFELNMENYVTQSGYQQEHEEDGKWILWDGDNKSPGLVKLRLYWRDDSSSQHYELWAETSNLKYFETIVAQALMNCSMRNHLTSSLPIDQERNIWRFNSNGIESLKDSLPTGMQLVGSWEPSNASIKPQEEVPGVYYVEYGTTTYAEALAAYQAGKTLVLRKNWETLQHDQAADLYPCIGWYESGSFSFSSISGYMQYTYTLTPSATYTERSTVLATRYQVLDTLNAEIAPEWSDLSMEHYTAHDWPIPAGTVVTQIDNTSSDTLQWVYRSKVAIDQNEVATSGPLQDPSKWDKVHICDIMSSLFYADICVTPFADIKAAYDRGDVIMGRSGRDIYPLYSSNLGTSYSDSFTFACLHGTTWYQWVCYQNSTGYEATNGWATPPGMVLFPERQNISDGYSNQRTYAVGDLCYNGSLYRCTTAIPTPENWTAAHWTVTSIDAELARFATVARTGDYNDLINTPTIPADKVFNAIYGTTTFAEIEAAVSAGKLVFLTGHPNNSDMVLPLATITSPRPSIAVFGGIVGHYQYGAKIDSGTWSYSTVNLVESSELATVATTGDYNDLNNLPTIPAAQVQADWNQTDSSAVDYIKNKPDVDDVVIYNYGTATLTQINTAVNAGKLVLVGRSVGAHDYYGYLAEYNSGAYSFIYKDGNYLVEMKISPDAGDGTWSMTSVHIPTVDQTFDGTSGHAQSGVAIAGELANYTPTSGLATVATTGDYDDLSNKPSIPTIGTITV